MQYLGDYTQNRQVFFKFNTQGTGNEPISLTGTPAPAVQVFKDNSTTPAFSGVTLNVDFASITGLNHVEIDTSVNAGFYTTGSNFSAVIATGTVDGISVVGKELASFSIINRSDLNFEIEDGYPVRDSLKLILSSCAAPLSGASGVGNTIFIRDVNDTTNRIIATVNSSGDRLSVNYNVS